jgi:putative molybdopterin biosynthesis protein
VEARVPLRIASEMGRKEFVLVSLVSGEHGAIAFPSAKGSGAVTSFSQADGFIEIDALAGALDADTTARVMLIGATSRAPDLVIMGSHDIALDVVIGALAEQGFATRAIAVGSQGGVAAALRGQCDLAPVHLIDPATGVYNKHLLASGLALVKGWQRMQGVLFRPGDARFEGNSAQDAVKAALADPSCLMVNRNAGAGTRVLIDRLVGGARPPGYANQPRSHNAVGCGGAEPRRLGVSTRRWREPMGWLSRSRLKNTISWWWRAAAIAGRAGVPGGSAMMPCARASSARYAPCRCLISAQSPGWFACASA